LNASIARRVRTKSAQANFNLTKLMAPPAKPRKIDAGQQQFLLGATEVLFRQIQNMQKAGKNEMPTGEAELLHVIKVLAQTLLDLIGNDSTLMLLTDRLKGIIAFRSSYEIAHERYLREH
jgi:hypothetical protein